MKLKKPYVLITMHRAETVDNKNKLEILIETLKRLSEKYSLVYPIHPRTVKMIEVFGLKKALHEIKNLTLIEPVGYFDFLMFLKNAHLLLTDSGGALKEATAFKIPTIIYNDNWPDKEGYGVFWHLSGYSKEGVISLVEKIEKENIREKIKNIDSPFGDGKASERIAKICSDYLEGKIKMPKIEFTSGV